MGTRKQGEDSEPVRRGGRSLREASASRRTARPEEASRQAFRSDSGSRTRSVGIRPRFSALDRTGRGRSGRCVHRLGARSLARNLAVGDDRVSPARLRRRRAQRDARGGSFRKRTGCKTIGAIGSRNLRLDTIETAIRRWPIQSTNSKSPNCVTARPHRRARDRIHQFRAVHGDYRRSASRRC